MNKKHRVFVIHGRDELLRERMFDFMRALGLWPMEWERIVRATRSTAPSLDCAVRHAPKRTQAAVVLMTPDDVVHLHPALQAEREPPYETEPTCQPRPDVLYELGIVRAIFPKRTIIVEIGNLRPISDLAGLNVIRFDGSPCSLGKLVERLKLAGCAVDDQGSDWRNPERFEGLQAYRRQPPGRRGDDADPLWTP